MKQEADIYRMVAPEHLCPWGIKALDLLKRNRFDVQDHHLESMEANERYKEEQNVDETPQIFIEGERLGGYDQLREHLDLQSRLYRKARSQMRLRGRRQQRPTRIHLPYREPDDDGNGHLDDGASRIAGFHLLWEAMSLGEVAPQSRSRWAASREFLDKLGIPNLALQHERRRSPPCVEGRSSHDADLPWAAGDS